MEPSKTKANAVDSGDRAVVGIDVGKRFSAAAGLAPSGKLMARLRRFYNNRAGIDLLEQKILGPLSDGHPERVLLAMESTGPYWFPLYFELTKRGYSVVVINPIQTGNRSRARIRKTKTDPIDSLGIARLIHKGEAQSSRLPKPEIMELRIITRKRWGLRKSCSNLKCSGISIMDRIFPEFDGLFDDAFNKTARNLITNYGLNPQKIADEPVAVRELVKKASRNRITKEKIDELLKRADNSIGVPLAQEVFSEQLQLILEQVEDLEKKIKEIDKQLEVRIESFDSPLKSLGLKAPLIATIHAESDPIKDFHSAREYVAYVGLDPSTSKSGNGSKSTNHISKRGSTYLRQAYYLAASAMYRHHKDLNRIYWRRRKKKNHHIDALVVVAHKLVRISWRILTDNRNYRKTPPRLIKPKKKGKKRKPK